jgi:hypothetical protein
MTRYFYDCEFLEGTQTKRFLGIPYGKTKPTIDLISIGIVAEDGRELYLISKEFNLREAWERYEYKDWHSVHNEKLKQKVYWIRENVLKPIFEELCKQDRTYDDGFLTLKVIDKFTYKNLKYLINKYGYTNAEIAEKVKSFCLDNIIISKMPNGKIIAGVDPYKGKPELYGYYSAYDHVVLCWLFGKMIDLPKGFPMYTIDLKQKIAFIESNVAKRKEIKAIEHNSIWNKIDKYEEHVLYPKKTNEHNALADARWNKELYNFIKSL